MWKLLVTLAVMKYNMLVLENVRFTDVLDKIYNLRTL